MERLSKEKRKEFMKRAMRLSENAWNIIDQYDMNPKNIYDINFKDILMRKYRMVSCIKLLDEFGMGERFKDMELFDFYEAYNAVQSDRDFYENLDEFVYDTAERLNEKFFCRCLDNTDWEIFKAEGLEDYEVLEESVVKKLKGIIGKHWNILNRYYYSQDEKADSEYLKSLGCEPIDYWLNLLIDCNLILTNESIKEMLHICKKHKKYRRWEEYKELSQIKSFCLFDRYYKDLSKRDLKQENWQCLSYMLGRVAESDEEVSMYWLHYESVFCLMITDMIAKEFLERYHSQEESVEWKKKNVLQKLVS